MLKINEITSRAKQRRSIQLPTGQSFVLHIEFLPLQYGWFIRDLSYGSFKLKNIRITNSLNVLRQFKNSLPFGLACISEDGREPSLIEDFSSGHSSLFVLTEDEMKSYEEHLKSEV